MEGIEGSAVGALAGVLEDFVGGTNADDLHPEEGFAADIYHRKSLPLAV